MKKNTELQQLRNTKGITLIALVITIVILLILAAVSIGAITGENGIITRAGDAAKETKDTDLKEQVDLAITSSSMQGEYTYNKDNAKAEIGTISGATITDNGDGTLTVEKNGTTINVDKNGITTIAGQTGGTPGGSDGGKTEIPKDTEPAKSYVANYADIDDDGTVDGIIYADLITGATGDGQWTDSDGNYTIPKINSASAKNYYISKEIYEGPFGTGKVISPISETTGEDRFYVMALEDFNTGTYYHWYYSGYENMSDYATYTSQDFGKGKENTDRMLTKWNNAGYGAQNAGGTYKDLWGEITTEVNKGWYVPSRAEWAAFGGEIAEKLNITTSNYGNFGLSDWYWSSSQGGTTSAWYAYFYIGSMSRDYVNFYDYVRLGSTF